MMEFYDGLNPEPYELTYPGHLESRCNPFHCRCTLRIIPNAEMMSSEQFAEIPQSEYQVITHESMDSCLNRLDEMIAEYTEMKGTAPESFTLGAEFFQQCLDRLNVRFLSGEIDDREVRLGSESFEYQSVKFKREK